MEKTYFFESYLKYCDVVSAWKNYLLSGGKPTSSHMMLYNVFRTKQWNRGFSPTTKAIKLANGCDPWQGRKNAMWGIEKGAKYGGSFLKELLLPFGDISPEDIKRAWELINEECKKLK